MKPEWGTIIALAAVIVGPFVTWMVAKRTASGRIQTSTADTLWREATALREAYLQEIVALRTELASARAELSGLRTELIRKIADGGD